MIFPASIIFLNSLNLEAFFFLACYLLQLHSLIYLGHILQSKYPEHEGRRMATVWGDIRSLLAPLLSPVARSGKRAGFWKLLWPRAVMIWIKGSET